MNPENKKGHRPDQGTSGDKKLQQVYSPAANLSILQSLVVGLLAIRLGGRVLFRSRHVDSWIQMGCPSRDEFETLDEKGVI